MAIEIKAPTFPESVADGEVAVWHKAEGESVSRDELIVEIETDKVVLEVVAPEDGVISAIHVQAGETIQSSQLLATMEAGAAPKAGDTGGADASESDSEKSDKPDKDGEGGKGDSKSDGAAQTGPAARQLIDEHGLDAARIPGSGKGGRVTKEDVLKYLKEEESAAESRKQAAQAPADSPSADAPLGPTSERVERRVPMTRMRAKIAERLLHATQETAMLTTFNEVNMAPVMELRRKYKEQFEKTHNGTRLGFMGFFVKAASEALERFPAVNASIDGSDVVYHGYQDIGVAVSTPGGLVVPVLRDADFMSLADIEAAVSDLGKRARDNKLSIDDMTGGTFTVTNGGVFGSLLSTPILNPPQTGILGMHKIQE